MSNARFSILQARAVKDKCVSDAQFRTLAALGMYANEDGWCFPSLTTLGNDLHKSKQAVGRDTIHLRKLGYLEVTPRFDEKTGARRSSLYRLKFDLPPLDASTPSTDSVDGYSTDSVDGASTSEVDVNDPINDPLNNVQKERDPFISHAKKGDLVDGYLDLAQSPGIKRAARIDSILSYLAGKLRINTETKRWKEFAKFVDDRQQIKDEKVDMFVSWLISQKNFDIQFWPPSKMQEMWPQAFTTDQPAAVNRNKYVEGEYAQYIEH